MRKKEYYLVASSYGLADVLYGPCDISEIDQYTLRVTKEEMMDLVKQKFPNKNLNNLDIYIVRKKIKNKKYYLKFYDCLFEPKQGIDLVYKIMRIFASFASWRSDKINKEEKNIWVGDHPNFDSYIYLILNNIMSNNSTKNKLMSSHSFVHEKVKERASSVRFVSQIKGMVNYSKKYLKNYKELRGLTLEYLQHLLKQEQIITRDNFYRLNANYSSDFFDYLEPFYVNVFNASVDSDKTLGQLYCNLFLASTKEEEELVEIPFENKALEQLYEEGGTKAVIEQMELEKLYSTSLTDLAKSGVISMENYLNHKQRPRSLK